MAEDYEGNQQENLLKVYNNCLVMKKFSSSKIGSIQKTAVNGWSLQDHIYNLSIQILDLKSSEMRFLNNFANVYHKKYAFFC